MHIFTLTDSRDGNSYRIARLKDGNCWMQDNLRLNGGRTLTPADSNVTSNVTLPNNITSGTSVNTAMQIITGSNGNFYNWCAAIAIGNCSNLNTNQSTSICPKNWYLPDSGSISSNKSWANLTRAYEVTTGPELVNVPVLNFKIPVDGIVAV